MPCLTADWNQAYSWCWEGGHAAADEALLCQWPTSPPLLWGAPHGNEDVMQFRIIGVQSIHWDRTFPTLDWLNHLKVLDHPWEHSRPRCMEGKVGITAVDLGGRAFVS